MKPAPVLVVSLEVHVGRGAEVRPVFQHGGMAHTGIEPDVEDVRLLLEPRPAALGAAGSRRHQLFRFALEPDVGAVFPDKTDHMIENRLRHHLRPARVAIEHRDRDAPEPLARYAPVGPVLDHAVYPVASPGGNPGHRVDGGKGLLPEVVFLHGDEPLFRRAEDDRLLAAPAVRIGVPDLHLPEEGALLPEPGDHRTVGVKDELPREVLDVACELSIIVHGGVIFQAIRHPDLVVLLAVARSDMDRAGTGVEGDEGGEDQQALPVDQRMAALLPLHDGSGKLIEDLIGFIPEAEGLHAAVHKVLCDDEDLALDLHGHVEEILMEGDRQIRGDRPGGRRPDDDGDLLAGELRDALGNIGNAGKFDIDRRRRVVLVFDLRFRERGLARGAPVDGLLPLVDASVQVELPELGDRRRLVAVGHRKVGLVPLPEHPETFELLPLDPHVSVGVNPAETALVRLGHRCLLFAQFLVHLVLDGQTVTVPAGDVYAVAARHVLRLDEDVLDDLVERGAQVDIPVGIGGTVMEDVGFPPFRVLADPFVDAHPFPAGEHLRLPLRQVGLHRKLGLRQIQCILVIHETALLKMDSLCKWRGKLSQIPATFKPPFVFMDDKDAGLFRPNPV